jgi:hypothetical protein
MTFFQEQASWNCFGYGALLRYFRDIPVPSADYYGPGTTFQAMGVKHSHLMTQLKIGSKVQMRAADLERVPYGYRSAVGCQVGRLVHKVEGPEYGSSVHVFLTIRYVLASPKRFESHFEK